MIFSETPTLLADLVKEMEDKRANEQVYRCGSINVKVTSAYVEPPSQAKNGVKYGRVEGADSSARLEIFFFDTDALAMATKFVQDGYYTVTGFYCRKQEHGCIINANPEYTDYQRLAFQPAECKSIAAPRLDASKFWARVWVSGVQRVFLNLVCAGCDRDILGSASEPCKTAGCSRFNKPPEHTETMNFKVTLTLTVSNSNEPQYGPNMATSVMLMHASKKQLVPHLMRLFPRHLVQQLLKRQPQKVSFKQAKASLVEMLEVWAECLTNSRLVVMTVYNFTTKFNHQVHDPETGGRRYLIDMDVDYDMITDQVKASTELKRTIRALENLLA